MASQLELFDSLVRHQVFLEDYKEFHADNHARAVRRALRRIRGLLNDLDVDDLSQLTQAQYRRFLRDVRRVYEEETEEWYEGFLAELPIFSREDIGILVAVIIFNTATPERRDELLGRLNTGRIFNSIMRQTNPGVGMANNRIFPTLIRRTVERITQQFNMGRAQQTPMRDLRSSIVGTERNGLRDGMTRNLSSQGRANITSIIQHVYSSGLQFVGNAAARIGLIKNTYVYKAVLDTLTSRICRSFNNLIFRYGQGPIPPLHPNCRSSIIPLLLTASARTVQGYVGSWFSWINQQPTRVQNRILGRQRADALRRGEITAETLGRFTAPGVKNLQQFRAMEPLIIEG